MAVFPRFPRSALSRGLAGVRDGLEVLNHLVEHAVELVSGVQTGD
jgi:hypothetical protein